MQTSTPPLIQALLRCDFEDFVSLLHSGEDYQAIDSNGLSALHWAVSRKQTAFVMKLLEHHKLQRQQCTLSSSFPSSSQGLCDGTSRLASLPIPTPLELAADNEDLETFELLLEHLEAPMELSAFNPLWLPPPSSPSQPRRTSVFWRTNEDIARYLEEAKPWDSKIRLAHLAIRHSKPQVLRLLLASGTVDINSRFLFNNQTLLHTSAFQRDPQCTRILLDAGADPTLIDDFGRTALQQALGHGHVQGALLIIEAAGCPVDMCPGAHQFPPFTWSKIPADASPLMLACGLTTVDPETQMSLVRRLLQRGADPNAADRRGRTPLHVAAACDAINVLRDLLDSGANPSAKSLDGRTVYHYFSQRQPSAFHPNTYEELSEILELLLSKYDPRGEDLYDASGTHPLEIAAEASQAVSLRALVDHGFVADKPGTLRGVEDATWARDTQLLELLLPIEDLKQVDTYSMNPLKGLIPSDEGLTTLPQETIESILATIRLLDSAGGFGMKDATNALRLVVRHFRNPELAEALLECGAQVVEDCPGSWDLCQLAAVNGNHEVLDYLLQHFEGQQPPSTDHWLVHFNHMQHYCSDNVNRVLRCMKECGFLDTPESAGFLHKAILDGNARIVKLLVDNDINVQLAEPQFGWTPLHTVAYTGRADILEILLAADANVNAFTLNWGLNSSRSGGWGCELWGAQPLHVAALWGHLEIAQALISAGADVQAKVSHDNYLYRSTALDVALGLPVHVMDSWKEENHARLSVAQLLVRHGARPTPDEVSLTRADFSRFVGFEALWDTWRFGRYVQ